MNVESRTIPHNGWRPRPYQMDLWEYLQRGGKRASCIWHRRAGKDELMLHWTAVSILKKPAVYWTLLPEFGQGRKAIWSAVNPHTGIRRIDEAFPHYLRLNTSENEMFIRFKNGATWQVVGSDRYDSAVGSPPYGITFSEWALSNPSAWAYLAPILVENGGWACFITTPRGRNHAYTMHKMAEKNPEWFAQTLPVSKTKALSLEDVDKQLIEYTGVYGEEAAQALVDQEYHCSFEAAVLGAFYGKLMAQCEEEGRITKVDINPDIPIQKAWDLGVDDPTAIWVFQVYPGHIEVIDYYENHSVGLDHYADWLSERGYDGTDWVPHDARVREFGAPGARSRLETMAALGLKPSLVPDAELMDGINAGRLTIPIARFDEIRCARGIECLRQYKTGWDEKNHTFKKTPLHDWSSHGADAWRYLSVAWRHTWTEAKPVVKQNKPLHMMTYDELHELETMYSLDRSRRI